MALLSSSRAKASPGAPAAIQAFITAQQVSWFGSTPLPRILLSTRRTTAKPIPALLPLLLLLEPEKEPEEEEDEEKAEMRAV